MRSFIWAGSARSRRGWTVVVVMSLLTLLLFASGTTAALAQPLFAAPFLVFE